MSKFLQRLFVLGAIFCLPWTMNAQQLPNAGFEDWSGATFNNAIQPKSWNASNVEQLNFKFNFAHREAGHSGSYSMMVQDQDVGAAGITETSPGYVALGQPWVYLESLLKITEATAGTYGGISWKYRPDSMVVWIKRTGNHTAEEDFYLLYYAWSGTAKGNQYKGKNGNCTSVSKIDEESDVRQALNYNECGTAEKANQIAEGMWREKKTYSNWTRMSVPIYYFNSDVPQKMNIIFSASNYPNFRANSGLYAGNSLYIDDVELVYSAKIQKLYIGSRDKEWKAFDPNSQDVQTYSLGESATEIPAIYARRGVGMLTNAKGTSVSFPGRELTASEMTIEKGDLENKPTTITVKSEDGKSQMVYKIQFQRAPSSNATLAEVQINGENYAAFRPAQTSYNVELPYGTKTAPVLTYTQAEDAQKVTVEQAASPTGTATVTVTAADGTTTKKYTFNFTVGELKDATLKDIKVNGKSLLGFTPSQAIYKVSLPVGTSTLTVEPVSAYDEGEQTIVVTPNPLPAGEAINGATVQINVTAGKTNPVSKTYRLNIKLEKSSYSYLKDLQVKGEQVEFVNPSISEKDSTTIDFSPENLTYYVTLKMGTKELPAIDTVRGDEFQTIKVESLPAGVVDGTVRIAVIAGNGTDQTVYKLVFTTKKSQNSTLKGIEIDGKPIEGFRPDSTMYTYVLPIEAASLPVVKPIPYDEFQEIKTYAPAGLVGKYRISVTAGNGSTTNYYIDFTQQKFEDNTLKSLSVEGYELQDNAYNPIPFDPQRNEYWVKLSPDATEVPAVHLERQSDLYQDTIVRRPSSTNGDYKVTVRPRSGASRTYVIHFVCKKSDNTALKMIYLDGKSLPGFDSETVSYTHVLDTGATVLPVVTWDPAEATQTITSVWEGRTIRITVQAQNGAKRTYKLKFVIPSAASTQLEMIYLDDVPLSGFRKDSTEYSVKLPYGATCPKISVTSAPGQHVTITAPYAAGTAYINVTTNEGDSQNYTIDFVSVPAATVQLLDILINNVSVSGFAPTTMAYTAEYEGELPVVKGIPSGAVETVNVVWNDTVAWLHVKDTLGNKAAYSVTFTHHLSADNSLAAIYENRGLGPQLIDGFKPSEYVYSYNLAPGSEFPELSYKTTGKAEVVFFGQLEKGKWGITVLAENGTEATYTVQYTIEKYSDATLKNLVVEGQTIAFDPNTFEYKLSIDEGIDLPQLTLEAREGQTVLKTNVNDTLQQVIVFAESGATNTYSIIYTRVMSSNALLADILIDGVSLPGFDPETVNYIDSLDKKDKEGHPTKVIPNVFPIGQNTKQTITTYYSHPDGVTRIHVVAQSGDEKDYFIAFPLRKSSNVELGDLMLDAEDVWIDYKPNTTDYVVELSYETDSCPKVIFEKAEQEQRIDYISRPLGDTTQVIVTAENGDTRTYNILFKREVLKKKNLLSAIHIKELDRNLSLKDKDQRDFNVELPFGSRSLTVEYEKSYPEQTVFIQPGGVNNPTVITVKANNDSIADEVYTITPSVPTVDPAVLTDIKVNGTTIAGFEREHFSYIVKVTDKPILRYTLNKGAEINIIEQTSKHWKAEVTYGERTNTYEVWYYYENDVIPNAELNIDGVAKYNNAFKPQGWNTIADADDKYTLGFITLETSGEECQKASDGTIYLHTKYRGNCARNIPAFMTLGTVSGEINTNNSFSYSGSIVFRNSPDKLTVRYKAPTVHTRNHIIYQLWGSNGYDVIDEGDEQAVSSFKERVIDLNGINATVGDPTAMNIVLNSYYSTQGGLGTDGGMGNVAEMYVDWLRLSYNHTLASMKVDEFDATKDGNAFTATLTDPERIEKPILSFTGEVRDQAQDVAWSAETKDVDFGVRTATIRNWAENGADYTDYTLTVKRPLDTRNYLANLIVDSLAITGFDPEVTEYTVHMPASRRNMNDLIPVPASSLQTITTSFADSTMTITVTPENGEAKVYTVKFVTDLSDDTTLADIIADGVTFDAETREYDIEAEQLPLISFVKKSDLQTVSLVNGVITVTAENGAVGTYSIRAKVPAVSTTAILSTFSLGTNVYSGIGDSDFEEVAEKPDTYITFERVFPSDSVVFVQSPANMLWQVYGTVNNTYTWTYPTEKSGNAYLANITLDGEGYSEFVEDKMEYELSSDSTLVLAFVAAETSQQLLTTTETIEGGVMYTTEVIAENDTRKTYKVSVARSKSNIATLAGILLDSVMVEGFDPEVDSYSVTLPIPSGAKIAQPKMPNITYVTGHKGQKVSVETGRINGEQTHFIVQSEDGSLTKDYYLTVNAEPSHCSDLTGITVNGEALDHFEPGRHFYSVSLNTDKVVIDYTSDDRFQVVKSSWDTITAGREYRDTLRVTAEDGSVSDYLIEIYIENPSNDAQLANILLDDMDFVTYGLKSGINPKIKPFDPGDNNYHINVIRDSVPAVSARLKMNGQSVKIRTFKDSVYLDVWAVDSTENTYKLYFDYKKSTNTALKWITINDDTIQSPSAYFYVYDKLQMGEELPIVDAEPVNEMATVLIDRSKNPITITVIAEDESYQATYTLSCDFKPSTVNTLEMIYVNGQPWKGFDPYKFTYDTVLQAGETFPLIDYGELTPRDNTQWPYIDSVTVTKDTVEHIWVHQTSVTAQSNEMKVYTLTFTINKWNVDTLESIEVENTPLPNFKGSETEYYYTLTPTQVEELNGRRPALKYFKGEAHQTVDTAYVPDSYKGKSLGYKHVLTVRAENNSTRTYTVHYPVEPSSDATLRMIDIDGNPLKEFDPERTNYRIELDFGLPVPNVVAYTWNDDQITKQNQHGDTVIIDVWAEDKTYNSYTIIFTRVKSTVSTLDNIILTDKEGKQFPYEQFFFVSDSFDYTIVIPYDSTMQEFVVPDMKIIKSDPFQTVTDSIAKKLDEDKIEVYIHVVAPNNEDESEYKLTFIFTRNNDANLKDLLLYGTSVKGFNPATLDYKYTYPYGTDSTAFVNNDNVRELTKFVKSDPKATDTVYVEDNGTIRIVITAQDKKSQSSYSIQQVIGKDTVNTLKMLYLDGDTLKGFDPEQTFYTYVLKNGASNTPTVYGVPMSVNAVVDATEDEPKSGIVNDTLNIYCTAQDGTERIYRIYFRESEINDGIVATSSREVFIRRVSGANQLFVSTIRSGVFFYLYDRNGHMVYTYENLPPADPNSVLVSQDEWQNDIMLNADVNPNAGVYVDIIPGEVYFYSFVSAKKKIASGKLIALPVK